MIRRLLLNIECENLNLNEHCGRLIEMAYRDGIPLTDEDKAAIRSACEVAVNFGLKGHQIDLEINAGRMACRNGISSAS